MSNDKFEFLDESFDGAMSMHSTKSFLSDSEDDLSFRLSQGPNAVTNTLSGKSVNADVPSFLSSDSNDLGLGTDSISVANPHAFRKAYDEEVRRQQQLQKSSVASSSSSNVPPLLSHFAVESQLSHVPASADSSASKVVHARTETPTLIYPSQSDLSPSSSGSTHQASRSQSPASRQSRPTMDGTSTNVASLPDPSQMPPELLKAFASLADISSSNPNSLSLSSLTPEQTALFAGAFQQKQPTVDSKSSAPQQPSSQPASSKNSLAATPLILPQSIEPAIPVNSTTILESISKSSAQNVILKPNPVSKFEPQLAISAAEVFAKMMRSSTPSDEVSVAPAPTSDSRLSTAADLSRVSSNSVAALDPIVQPQLTAFPNNNSVANSSSQSSVPSLPAFKPSSTSFSSTPAVSIKISKQPSLVSSLLAAANESLDLVVLANSSSETKMMFQEAKIIEEAAKSSENKPNLNEQSGNDSKENSQHQAVDLAHDTSKSTASMSVHDHLYDHMPHSASDSHFNRIGLNTATATVGQRNANSNKHLAVVGDDSSVSGFPQLNPSASSTFSISSPRMAGAASQINSVVSPMRRQATSIPSFSSPTSSSLGAKSSPIYTSNKNNVGSPLVVSALAPRSLMPGSIPRMHIYRAPSMAPGVVAAAAAYSAQHAMFEDESSPLAQMNAEQRKMFEQQQEMLKHQQQLQQQLQEKLDRLNEQQRELLRGQQESMQRQQSFEADRLSFQQQQQIISQAQNTSVSASVTAATGQSNVAKNTSSEVTAKSVPNDGNASNPLLEQQQDIQRQLQENLQRQALLQGQMETQWNLVIQQQQLEHQSKQLRLNEDSLKLDSSASMLPSSSVFMPATNAASASSPTLLPSASISTIGSSSSPPSEPSSPSIQKKIISSSASASGLNSAQFNSASSLKSNQNLHHQQSQSIHRRVQEIIASAENSNDFSASSSFSSSLPSSSNHLPMGSATLSSSASMAELEDFYQVELRRCHQQLEALLRSQSLHADEIDRLHGYYEQQRAGQLAQLQQVQQQALSAQAQLAQWQQQQSSVIGAAVESAKQSERADAAVRLQKTLDEAKVFYDGELQKQLEQVRVQALSEAEEVKRVTQTEFARLVTEHENYIAQCNRAMTEMRAHYEGELQRALLQVKQDHETVINGTKEHYERELARLAQAFDNRNAQCAHLERALADGRASFDSETRRLRDLLHEARMAHQHQHPSAGFSSSDRYSSNTLDEIRNYYESEISRLTTERADQEAKLNEMRADYEQRLQFNAASSASNNNAAVVGNNNNNRFELQQQAREIDRMRDEFSKREAALQSELVNADQDITALTEANARLKIVINQLATSNTNAQAKAAAAAALAASTTSPSTTSSSSSAVNSGPNNASSAELERLHQQLDRLQEEHLDLQDELEKYKEDIEAKESELASLKTKVKTLQEKEDSSDKEISHIAMELERAQQAMEIVREDKIKFEQNANEYIDRNKKLDSELKQKKEDHMALKTMFDSQSKEVSALKNEIGDLKYRVEDQKAIIQDMRKEHKDVETALKNTENQVRQFILENESLRKQIAQEKKLREQAEKTVDSLKARIESMRNEPSSSRGGGSFASSSSTGMNDYGYTSPRASRSHSPTNHHHPHSHHNRSDINDVFRYPDSAAHRVISPPRYGPASTIHPSVYNAPPRRSNASNRESSDFVLSHPEELHHGHHGKNHNGRNQVNYDSHPRSNLILESNNPMDYAAKPPTHLLPAAGRMSSPTRSGSSNNNTSHSNSMNGIQGRNSGRGRDDVDDWDDRSRSSHQNIPMSRSSSRDRLSAPPPPSQPQAPLAQRRDDFMRKGDFEDKSYVEHDDAFRRPPPGPPRRAVVFDDPLGGADDDDDVERMIAMLESQNRNLKQDLFGDDEFAPPNAILRPPPSNRAFSFEDDAMMMGRNNNNRASTASAASSSSSSGGKTNVPFATEASKFENSAVQSKENELMKLNLERQQLEAEYAKLPSSSRTAAGRAHKVRMEARMNVLDEDISKLKTELRHMMPK